MLTPQAASLSGQLRPHSESNVLRSLSRNALRRNRLIAVLLVVFVAIAVMLASSAAALVITARGASASLMEQAQTPHFLQMHAGEVDEVRLAEFAETSPLVEQYAAVPMLNVDGAAIRVTGVGTDATLAAGLQDNSFVTQSADFDLLLDTQGQVISPEQGTVWLPLYYRSPLGLEEGQTLTVSGPEASVTLTVAGFLRDSQMNSSYASSKRLLVTGTDQEALAEAVGEAGAVEHLIQFRLTDPGAVGEFETEYRAAGLEANGPTVTWPLFILINSLSEGITASIVILVTLLLVAIALLCVRFTLLTTIEQDYREIGVLKAIGVRAHDLRRLYSRRYLMMAVAGALAGFIASWALSPFLLRNVRLFMGPSGRTGPSLLAGLVLSAVIVAVVWLTVRRTLRRLQRVSPVQAIRTGSATDVSGSRRAPLSVVGGWPGTNVRLGLRDLVTRRGLYVVPLVVYTLASFVLIVPQNLLTTVTRPDFITYMGAGVSDMRVDVQQPADPERVAGLVQDLAEDPQVTRSTALSTASYTAPGADGAPATVKIEAGDLAAFPLTYMEGRAPTTSSQIGMSQMQADDLGLGLGDEIVVTPVLAADGEPQPLELSLSGVYQDVTNGGRTAKMLASHTSADLMWVTVFADFEPGVDVTSASAGYAADNPDLKVSSVREYVDSTLGGTIDALRSSSIAALVIGLVVAALITTLFMRMLITRDAFPIAVMKALGFRERHIHTQYVVRSVVVLAVGVLLGAVLANTLGGALAGLLLSTIGLSQLTLVANPWLAYLATPVLLLAVVVVTTLLSSRPSDHLSISSTIKE